MYRLTMICVSSTYLILVHICTNFTFVIYGSRHIQDALLLLSMAAGTSRMLNCCYRWQQAHPGCFIVVIYGSRHIQDALLLLSMAAGTSRMLYCCYLWQQAHPGCFIVVIYGSRLLQDALHILNAYNMAS